MKPRTYTYSMLLAAASLVSALLVKPPLRLVYNPSLSTPRGFYLALSSARLHRGDLVIVRLPQEVARFADKRGYLPAKVPALKHIAATAGQRACMVNGQLQIDGDLAAVSLAADRMGRPLTHWNGCRRLLPGELFLLNAAVSSSFDSRYWVPKIVRG